MSKIDLDYELITSIVLEMNDRIKLLLDYFPRDKELEKLLRQFAATSIHLTLFMRDVFDYKEGKKTPRDEVTEKEFLDNCGCKGIA